MKDEIFYRAPGDDDGPGTARGASQAVKGGRPREQEHTRGRPGRSQQRKVIKRLLKKLKKLFGDCLRTFALY
jgi:hypothetical protein